MRPDYNFRQFKDAFHLLDDLKDIYQRAAKLVQIPETTSRLASAR